MGGGTGTGLPEDHVRQGADDDHLEPRNARRQIIDGRLQFLDGADDLANGRFVLVVWTVRKIERILFLVGNHIAGTVRCTNSVFAQSVAWRLYRIDTSHVDGAPGVGADDRS